MNPELGLGEEVHQRKHDRLEAESHRKIEFDCISEFIGIVQEWVHVVAVFT